MNQRDGEEKASPDARDKGLTANRTRAYELDRRLSRCLARLCSPRRHSPQFPGLLPLTSPRWLGSPSDLSLPLSWPTMSDVEEDTMANSGDAVEDNEDQKDARSPKSRRRDYDDEECEGEEDEEDESTKRG